MLAPYRVLDLTDTDGWLAGFLLAQLGAAVTLAEPEGGWPRDDRFAAYNRGKSSVVAGAAELSALAADADVVLHNGAWPVDLAALGAANPTLVTVSITPFGSTGPKADWKATDLILWAASGQMAVTGDRDRPPVRTTVPQAWAHGSADAAVGALVALHERERSGLGQHVDCSVQQSVVLASLPAGFHGPVGIAPQRREAGGLEFLGTRLRWIYPAIDGYVLMSVSFGAMIGPFQRRLMEWVCEEGFCDEATRDKNWVDYGTQLYTGAEPTSELDRVLDCIGAFVATKTKAQLLEGALARKLLVAPVSDSADVMASPQLAARGYWDEIDGVRYPGRMVRASATPLAPLPAAPATPGLGRPAPARPLLPAPSDSGELPFAGLKVLDLAWVAAAPLATRLLAYWGATVVRVESLLRPDLTRGALGHRDDIAEAENAITWQLANAGKLGLALNLTVPEARDVVRDLARWADVAVESFSPGAAGALGFGYEDLAALNPSIVMVSSCLMGQDGPLATFAGFGNLAASIAGFFDVTGWPDRPPAGPYMAYTDYVAPRFTMCSLLAALDHRRRTGQGQYLDFSQAEAATHFLAPALLEYQRTGQVVTRDGNRDPRFVPHALYPALGEDGWVAIVCRNDDEWWSLATEMRRPELAGLTTAERREREAELDEVIGAWTARQDPTGLHYRLQAMGVPAHRMVNTGELIGDAQLAHRGHFVWRPHPYSRHSLVDTPPMQLARTPGAYGWGGPTAGQHVSEVLAGILGYDEDRITDLAIAGALE